MAEDYGKQKKNKTKKKWKIKSENPKILAKSYDCISPVRLVGLRSAIKG